MEELNKKLGELNQKLGSINSSIENLRKHIHLLNERKEDTLEWYLTLSEFKETKRELEKKIETLNEASKIILGI